MVTKTDYKLNFPAIAEFSTSLKQPDGYGENLVENYRKFVVVSIYYSTKKDLKETARLMGWSTLKTLTYLDKYAII